MSDISQPVDRNVGFQFLDETRPTPQAHEALVVIIRETPTFKHFDPETLDLRVWAEEGKRAQGAVEELTIHHPWPGDEHYRVVLGRLILRDRVGKCIEAFTFGGELDVEIHEDLTLCRLRSEAPVFDLEEPGTLSALLVNEVEVELAELRGQAVDRLDQIELGLGRSDPASIYAACLISLEKRLQSFEHQELPEYQDLLHLVHTEIEHRRGQGKWPSKPERLSQLLLPDPAPTSNVG